MHAQTETHTVSAVGEHECLIVAHSPKTANFSFVSRSLLPTTAQREKCTKQIKKTSLPLEQSNSKVAKTGLKFPSMPSERGTGRLNRNLIPVGVRGVLGL